MKQLIRVTALVLCVSALLLTIFLGTQAQKDADSDRYQSEPLSPLTVTLLNVGKGDAILLTCEEESLVIDTGYDDTAPLLLDALEKAGVEEVDVLLLTHFDKDHVGGADKLIEALPVDRLLVAPYTSDAKQYQQFVKAAGEAGLTAQAVNDTLSFSLGDAQCTLYAPLLPTYEDENDYSLVLDVTHGGDSFLFAGDAEEDRLQEMMSQMPLEHTFLKLPHHGRAEDSSNAFLRAVNPHYAVITCSEEAPPDPEVLAILQDLDTETYLTSGGTVTVVSQGTGTLQISQG